jgi:hypothetical protein
MNPIPDTTETGTIGELLVQLRLLEFGVQAAPPLKDSGNDLIAIKDEVFKAIQVKTTNDDAYRTEGLPGKYHVLAVVQLHYEGEALMLDKSRVFLIPRDKVVASPRSFNEIGQFQISQATVDAIFCRL